MATRTFALLRRVKMLECEIAKAKVQIYNDEGAKLRRCTAPFKIERQRCETNIDSSLSKLHVRTFLFVTSHSRPKGESAKTICDVEGTRGFRNTMRDRNVDHHTKYMRKYMFIYIAQSFSYVFR